MSNSLRSCGLMIFRVAAIACLVCGLVLQGEGLARAQEASSPSGQNLGFLIGPVGGVNFTAYTTDKFNIASPPSEIIALNGDGSGASLGINLEFPLASNLHHFFIVEALLDSKAGDFISINGMAAYPDTPVTNMTAFVSESASLLYLLLNVGYKFNFVSGEQLPVGLALQFCMSLGLNVGSHITKTVTYYTTSIGFHDQTFVEPIDGVRAVRMALRPELLYDIPLTSSLLLTPGVGFDYPLTQVDRSRAWIANSAYAGIALHFAVEQ